MNNHQMNPADRDYVVSVLKEYLDSLPYDELEYKKFVLNRIIRFLPQKRNLIGRKMKRQKLKLNIHFSIEPKFWKRYQAFLLTQYHSPCHPESVIAIFDKLINGTYRKIGKLYQNMNSYYEKVRGLKEIEQAFNNI